MTKVGSRELKNRLGKYLARVRKGESILVTDRGKPVARLVPPGPDGGRMPTLDERLQELAAQGHLRLATKPFATGKPIRTKGKLASRMILEDRR